MTEKRKTGSNPLNTFLSQIPDYVGKDGESKQSKAETKPETKPKTKTKSNAKPKPESKTNTKTNTETVVKPEAKSIAETKTIAIAESETEAKTQSEPITETKTFTHAKTFANDIKERAAAQNELQRFEDSRKRQTYWLDNDTISKISELAEKSGCNKYHVVSAGVQMLYEYVFESPEEEDLQ